MEKIKMEFRESIAVLTLNNGTINAISPDLVAQCSNALEEARNEAQGLVLCGNRKFFSIGLDLPILLKFNRSEMTDFWHEFNRLVFELFILPLPTVCCMAGHAVAGGNIMALTCDFRFAVNDENKKIGMNEIKLGVPVPYLADMIFRQVIGDRAASHMMYSGMFISMPKAHAIGLIDELYAVDLLEQRSMEKAAELASSQNRAYAEIKANRIEEIKNRYEKNRTQKFELFLDYWFSKPAQQYLRDASKKFTKPKKE
ncbi:MAG: enoyl-CoA hydratase/isomerase family protein [Candidatus Aminicenantes bacterium]|nr:enoyl-CoA hydratase/isomerase family protein [Candidatus Aminicenantes bacterium]